MSQCPGQTTRLKPLFCAPQVGTVKLSMPAMTKLKQNEKKAKKAAAKERAAAGKGGAAEQ